MNPGPSRLAARILAVGALLFTSAAFAIIVFANRPEGATASDPASEHVRALQPPARAVAASLSELGRGGSTRPVRDRIRAALDATRAAERWLDGAGRVVAAERMENALARYADYLDSLGSVLANPRSPHRFDLAERARRAQAAFASLPDSGDLGATVSGWRRALAFAERRRAR